MNKWRYLVLMLAALVFAGCSTPQVKQPEVTEASARIPPPIFGTTTRAPNIPDDTTLGADDDILLTTSENETEEDVSGSGIPRKRIIYFSYDRSEIGPKYRTILEAHAAYLNKNPDASVRLEGHADERGSREYNLALGERRAEVTKDTLMGLGVFENQLNTLSYGEERPTTSGHNEKSWWRNRRVEIVYP